MSLVLSFFREKLTIFRIIFIGITFEKRLIVVIELPIIKMFNLKKLQYDTCKKQHRTFTFTIRRFI